MSRLLVGLHQLELGGSQLNALDLAMGARERGHEVELFAVHTGEPGPLADMARDRGFALTLARHRRERHARLPVRRSVATAMTRQARRMGADLLHVYEYPLILDAFYGPSRALGVPLVGTVYAMAIPSWLPRSATLVAGTADLVAEARRLGQRASLIEPPVNPAWDDPERVDGSEFRRRHGIGEEETVLGIVSRLHPDMKEEGIARAISALPELDGRAGARLRLLVTGDGESRRRLARRAESANAALGREAVTLTGALRDPRPAYAAADVALGMGGSALRAMAFGKPLIVLGKDGFSLPFEEATAEYFFKAGFYGVGAAVPETLAEQMALFLDEERRRRIGAWARDVVLERFGLDAAVEKLEEVFAEARHPPRRWLPAAVHTTLQRSAGELVGPRLRGRLAPIARRMLARGALS